MWIRADPGLCPQGVHDVRLAYIQFALSFLIAGDDSTVVQVLELKGGYAWGDSPRLEGAGGEA